MKGSESDKIRIFHIREAIIEIEMYCSDVGLGNLQLNSMFQNAIIRQLKIIGEAASRITSTSKKLTLKYNGDQ
jgi:uncharacterized protein with HEPN domain